MREGRESEIKRGREGCKKKIGAKKIVWREREKKNRLFFVYFLLFPYPVFLLGGLEANVTTGFPAEAAAAAADAAAAAGVGAPLALSTAAAVDPGDDANGEDQEEELSAAPGNGTTALAATPRGGRLNSFLVALSLNSVDCTREHALLVAQYTKTPAGIDAVRGTSATARKRMKFFILRMVAGSWPCIPSAALSSTVSRKMPAESRGRP